MDYNIYLICLGVGFLFTVVSALFGHVFGGGHDGSFDLGHDGEVVGSHGHAESGVDNSDMPGVSAFSPLMIACFITAFGGLGIIFHSMPGTKAVAISAPLSAVGAVIVTSAVLWMLRQLFSRTQGSSESRLSTIVGKVANVISPIPANGVGEIAYVQGGSRYTAPAREQDGLAVANGQSVKIIRVTGSQFYVKTV